MKAAKALPVCFFMISVLYSAVFCQNFHNGIVKTFNVADGLPQSFISGLAQDSTGFIWIATRDGLARYDGKEFKIFRHKPGDSTTLTNNTIYSLHLGSQNRLWIFYETGDIDILNTCTEALFHFTKTDIYKPISGMLTPPRFLVEDDKGNIWMLGNGGIFICNLEAKTLHFYPDSSFGIQDRIVACTAYEGNIMIVTRSASFIINTDRKILRCLPHPFLHFNSPDSTHEIKKFFSFSNGNEKFIFYYKDRLVIYYPRNQSYATVLLPDKKIDIGYITEDSAGLLYFDYENDIDMVGADHKLQVWKSKRDNPKYGLKSMLVDRSGVLWTGGNGTGIQCYDLRLSRFQAMEYQEGFITDILKSFLHAPEAQMQGHYLYKMNSYSLRWFHGNDGKLWFTKGINKLLTKPEICYYKNGHFVQPSWYFTDTATSRHVAISAIAQTPSGKLWGIDFFMRPVYFDTLNGAVTVYPPVAKINTDYTYTVSSLCMDSESKFWISTAMNGLFCYDKSLGKTVHYGYSESPGALPTNQLMNIVQDSSDSRILWIGSLGGGLICFNKTTGKCLAYTVEEGLPNNTVYGIISSDKNTLWCSTNKGIFSFDTEHRVVLQSFTSKDGLPGDEFNRYHFLKLPDKRIAFGGVNGYTVFNPLSLTTDTFEPTVALTGISINNSPADFGAASSPFKAAINSLLQIRLPYNQNFITIRFAALQFNITEKLKYRYRLVGVNDNWVYAGTNNIATYTNLPPGNYLFTVNATNTSGQWSHSNKTISVIIDPPFWKTWWFIMLEVVAATALIYFIIHNRIKQIRKEEGRKREFERQASELKAQALRAQMNPHFMFNCLNSIKALIQEDNKTQAIVYLTSFSKLIRHLLDSTEEKISLFKELQICRLYTQLEALRFGDKVLCEFRDSGDIDLHSVHVPSLILQPFIENAIWHGILPNDGGVVKITVQKKEPFVECTIDDNGIGRERAMRNKSAISNTYESKGMKLVENRLHLHNSIYYSSGSIEVIDKTDADGNATGTLVKVVFKADVYESNHY